MKQTLSRGIQNSTCTFLQCGAKIKHRKIKRQIEEIIYLINSLIDEEARGRRVEKMIVCNSPAIQNEVKFSLNSLIEV